MSAGSLLKHLLALCAQCGRSGQGDDSHPRQAGKQDATDELLISGIFHLIVLDHG